MADVICLTPPTIPEITILTPPSAETQKMPIVQAHVNHPPKEAKAKKIKIVKPKAPKAPTAAGLKAKHHHANHPPWADMMSAAIKNLNEKHGSSMPAIKKYILSSYSIDTDKITPMLRRGLKAGLASKKLRQVKGHGLSGSFKTNPVGGTVKKNPKTKKPKVKGTTAKKPTTKKAKKGKNPAKKGKKVKMTIKSKGSAKKATPVTPALTATVLPAVATLPTAETVTIAKAPLKPKKTKAPAKPKGMKPKKKPGVKKAPLKTKLAKSPKARKAPKPKTTIKSGRPKLAATAGGAKKK